MRLIVKCNSTNEFSEGCEFALIDLTKELATRILSLKRMFDECALIETELDNLTFMDCSAEYFGSAAVDETLDELVGCDDPFFFAPAAFELSEPERTECDRMLIDANGVRWQCYPKHAEWLVTTNEIDYETVEQAARTEATQ